MYNKYLSRQSIYDRYSDDDEFYDEYEYSFPTPEPADLPSHTRKSCCPACPPPCPAPCPPHDPSPCPPLCPPSCPPCSQPCPYEFCFTVTKRDGTTGVPLANAEYTLYQSGEALGYMTSDTTGRLKFNGLFPGIYVLQETRSPDGYELDPAAHLVRISRNGSITIDGISLADFRLNDSRITIASYPFSLTKLDSANSQPLAGVTFRLTDGTASVTATTGPDGIAFFGSLEPGTYSLTETEVPDRYELTDKIYTVIIDSTGRITVDGDASADFTLSNNRLVAEAPAFHSIAAGSLTVSGTGVPGALVTVTFPDLSVVQASVGAQGIWTAAVPAGITLTAGSVITAYQTRDGYFSSPAATAAVQAGL